MKKKHVMQHSKPTLKWQKGDYKRHITFRCSLPYQFLLLCKLIDITPAQLLTDFMDNMACESWKREGRDKPKQKLIEYFIEHGYGQRHYSIEEIQMIFKEMDAIGMLYPKNAEASLIDEHTRWRESYHSYWFKKWFRKNKRDL